MLSPPLTWGSGDNEGLEKKSSADQWPLEQTLLKKQLVFKLTTPNAYVIFCWGHHVRLNVVMNEKVLTNVDTSHQKTIAISDGFFDMCDSDKKLCFQSKMASEPLFGYN